MERDIIFINAMLTHLELLQNFHDENTAAFCLIFVVEIRQHLGLGASQHTKYYSYQAFAVRIQWKDAPFSWKKFGKVTCLVHYGALVGFVPVYTTCVSTFILGQVEAHQSIKHGKCNFYMIFIILLFIKIVSFPLFLLIWFNFYLYLSIHLCF